MALQSQLDLLLLCYEQKKNISTAASAISLFNRALTDFKERQGMCLRATSLRLLKLVCFDVT